MDPKEVPYGPAADSGSSSLLAQLPVVDAQQFDPSSIASFALPQEVDGLDYVG